MILCCILNYCTTVGSGEYVKHDGLLNKERDRVKITIVIHRPLCVCGGGHPPSLCVCVVGVIHRPLCVCVCGGGHPPSFVCVCVWWGSSTVLCVCVCVWWGGGGETTHIPNYLCDIKFNIFSHIQCIVLKVL